MEKITNTKGKKSYIKPEFSMVQIDNEISLVMMSGNATPDGEDGDGFHPNSSIKPDNFGINPFRLLNF